MRDIEHSIFICSPTHSKKEFQRCSNQKIVSDIITEKKIIKEIISIKFDKPFVHQKNVSKIISIFEFYSHNHNATLGN